MEKTFCDDCEIELGSIYNNFSVRKDHLSEYINKDLCNYCANQYNPEHVRYT